MSTHNHNNGYYFTHGIPEYIDIGWEMNICFNRKGIAASKQFILRLFPGYLMAKFDNDHIDRGAGEQTHFGKDKTVYYVEKEMIDEFQTA